MKTLTASDIQFVKGLLPDTYDVVESKSKVGSIRCISRVGIRHNGDADDDEHWNYIAKAIKKHFGFRFQEIYHNVNFCHTDFTIFLKND